MKYSLSFLLLLFSVSFLSAQTEKDIRKEAEELYGWQDYRQALPLYLQLDSISPDNAEYKARTGICYLNSDHKHKSLSYLLKAKELGSGEKGLEKHIGEAYHFNHKFHTAISHFEKAVENLNPKKDKEELRNIKRQIEMCRNGIELVKDPVHAEIEHLSEKVNTQYPEFVPLISADESVLIFTSRRPSSTGGHIEISTGQYFEDIYISEKDGSGIWSSPEHIGGGINSEGHDACVSLSATGDRLFLYKEENMGDLYVSELNGSEWSTPERLPDGINSKAWEPSCAINPDETLLIFTSDRKGGYGGRDLYYVTKLPDDTWSEPVNMGPEINTEYDEDAPFIHPDSKTLYFSSKGHNSMGGFDIFTSQFHKLKDNSLSSGTPHNMGYPINTAEDDVFFVWSADGSRAYFSSFREDSEGEKDIYMLHVDREPPTLIMVKGKVRSEKTGKPVPATITVTDNKTKQVVGVYTANEATGKYLVLLQPGENYGVSIDEEGYLPYSENINVPKAEGFAEFEKNILLESLEEGATVELKNVFFDTDKWELRDESSTELDNMAAVLKKNPDVYIEIAGHTDSTASTQHNDTLSNNRAKAVIEYLAKKGVEESRMFPVGYGEEFPVADNGSEKGRQMNRRTELIVITPPEDPDNYQHEGYYYIEEKSIQQTIQK